MIRSGELSAGVSHWRPPSSKSVLCIPAQMLEEIISISFWPAVDARLPDWPTQYNYTVILFTLAAPLSLKLNNALKDLLSFLLGSVISGLRVNEKRDAWRQGPVSVSLLMVFQSRVGFACLL